MYPIMTMGALRIMKIWRRSVYHEMAGNSTVKKAPTT